MIDPHRPALLKGALVRWARRNEDVWEFWLFGHDNAADDSAIVSIGLVLAPVDGDHSRALGDFSLLNAKWRSELRAITRRPVKLEPMVPGFAGDSTIRSTGVCLWRRAVG